MPNLTTHTAYAISFMDGVGNLAGWRWVGSRISGYTQLLTLTYQLFILEGIPAIFCGIYTFFYLPNCESQPGQEYTVEHR